MITPCFNGGRFIKECVESVQKCVTLGEFEVEHIVVDDGSTDDSRQILSKLESSVKVILNATNLGPGQSRNVGLSATDAQYVFFLDVDDLIFGNSLRLLYNSAKKGNRVWVYGDFLRGDAQAKYLVGEDYYGWPFENAPDLLASLYSGKHFFQQNSLFLKSEIDALGGFRPEVRMGEDFDLCTRLLLKQIVPQYVSGPLYMHRFHGDNLSVKLTLDPNEHRLHVKEMFLVYKSSLEKMLDTNQMQQIYEFLG